jgi:hypothetical protein
MITAQHTRHISINEGWYGNIVAGLRVFRDEHIPGLELVCRNFRIRCRSFHKVRSIGYPAPIIYIGVIAKLDWDLVFFRVLVY